MTQEIIIEVTTEGEVTISTTGYKGQSCKDATLEFEKALGQVTSDTPTPEAYEREAPRQRIHNRSRA